MNDCITIFKNKIKRTYCCVVFLLSSGHEDETQWHFLYTVVFLDEGMDGEELCKWLLYHLEYTCKYQRLAFFRRSSCCCVANITWRWVPTVTSPTKKSSQLRKSVSICNNKKNNKIFALHLIIIMICMYHSVWLCNTNIRFILCVSSFKQNDCCLFQIHSLL